MVLVRIVLGKDKGRDGASFEPACVCVSVCLSVCLCVFIVPLCLNLVNLVIITVEEFLSSSLT